ncbi:hypothetical protein BDV93DRAFT_544920 [Ceratobasidium sp. AG-I]|nr:hypothetical protein BDV93DRAFT_544920 [Ceratobasidium sp. AG-I]
MPSLSAPEGVTVPDDLADLQIGILSVAPELQLFYCLCCNTCLPGICLAKHLNGVDHVNTRPQRIKSQLNAAIAKYQSLVQWNNPIVLPEAPVEYLPALGEPVFGQKCRDCFKAPHPIWFDNKQESKHFTMHHPRARDRTGDEGYFQHLFAPRYAGSYYGVISVKFHPGRLCIRDATNGLKQAAWEACLADLPQPRAPPIMPPVTDYVDASPYLSDVRWARQVAGFNIHDLQQLVELPSPIDHLYPIRSACDQLFTKHLKAIDDCPSVIRQLWTKGSYNPRGEREFTMITSATKPKYCNRMIAITCWLLRMARRLSSDETDDDTLYTCPMDKTLLLAANKALEALDDLQVPPPIKSKRHKRKPREDEAESTTDPTIDPLLVQNLLMACFAPDKKSFERLNAFDDPTHAFCMLAAIQESGQFAEPHLITSPLAATQYLFRSTLLYHLTSQYNDPECDIGKLARDLHQNYLTQDDLTPWGHLQALKRTTWTHTNSSPPPPTVQWVSDSEASVKGKLVQMDHLKLMGRGIIPELRDILYAGLLFGLDPKADLGLAFDHHTLLVDDLSCKTPNYSVFSDRNNAVFHGLVTALYEKVVKHPKISESFYKKVDRRGKPIFIYRQQVQWLRLVSGFSSKLACAMHILGGQPGRKSEFLTQYIFNRLHRLRNLVWFRDALIFVLSYSKISQAIGKDRVIAHGLPWELTELIVHFVVLVRPLAVIWVRNLFGDTRANLQSDYLFAQQGAPLSPYRFSCEFETTTEKYFGKKVNISEWRHLIIAVMRKLFKVEMELPEEEDNMDDLEMQAGHTAAMAKQTYGRLEAREWNQLQDDTMLKWIRASKLTYEWFLNSRLADPTIVRLPTAVPSEPSISQKRKRAQDDEYMPDVALSDLVSHTRAANRQSLRLKNLVKAPGIERLVFDGVVIPGPRWSGKLV